MRNYVRNYVRNYHKQLHPNMNVVLINICIVYVVYCAVVQSNQNEGF